MSYSYTNGDGLAALDAATPAASEVIALSGVQSIKQIKAYLKDTTSTVASYKKSEAYSKTEVDALIAGIPTPGSFDSNPSQQDAVNQTELADGNVHTVTGISYTAPATGTYFVSGLFQFDNVTAVASAMQIVASATINGSVSGQGNGNSTPSPVGARWFLSFSRILSVSSGQAIGLAFEPFDGVGTGQVKLTAVHMSVFRLST